MKKILIKIVYAFVLLIYICTLNVWALESEDVYYANSNGVEFTKDEYDFISDFYFEGYQEYMTMDNYLRLKSDDIMSKEINKVVMDNDGIQLFGESSYQSASKKIVMSYACGTTCHVSTVVSWLTVANVRSYDLIGAYSPTSNALKFVDAYMTYSGNVVNYTENNISTNGISATIKLPSTDAKYNFVLDFTVSSGAKVYASYQHAKKSISLANSRKYTFSSSGYGGVFKFDSSVSDYYDGMGGVSATIK